MSTSSMNDKRHKKKDSKHKYDTTGTFSLPGADFINNSNGVLVEQKVSTRRRVVGSKRHNRFYVIPKPGLETDERQNLGGLVVKEQNSFLYKMLFQKIIFPSDFYGLGRFRPLTLQVYGPKKDLMFTIEKTLKLLAEIKVFDARGQLVGKIQQKLGLLAGRLEITNAHGESLYFIKGRKKPRGLYKIRRAEGGRRKVGYIQQILGKVYLAKVGDITFDVQFPLDATIIDKILIIAAALMIDVIFWETHSDFRLLWSNLRSMLTWLRGVPVLQTLNHSTFKDPNLIM